MRLLARGMLCTGAVLLCLSTEAVSIYVATDGSDANSGTLESPLRTLKHAASKLLPGDTCYLRGGTYRETLTPAGSGTENAPITFCAYANELVTLSVSEVLTGWQAAGGGRYCAPVDEDLGSGYNQVFVDGTVMHEACFPNFGRGDLFHPAATSVTVGGSQGAVITSPAWSGHPDNYWVGAWFTGGIDVRWSWQCARVVGSHGDTITLDSATKSDPWFVGHGYGFIWGLEHLPDGDNEWQLIRQSRRNLLYVRLAGGANPAAHTVEIKARNWCVNFNHRSYITVAGLRLRGGAVWLSGNGNTLENCQARFLSHYMKYQWGYAYDGGFPQGSGVLIDGSGNTVYGCTISDTAGSGIISSGNDNVIIRNLIFNTDYSGTYACALCLSGTRNRVFYNTLHTSGRDILRPGGSGHSIGFNDFSHPGQMCLDTGVLYSWGVNALSATGARTRVAYNWFHDNIGSGATPLIYLDNWCRNFVLDHNVCWNSANDSGLRVNGPATGHLIYNNTLFHCDDLGTHSYNAWPHNNPDPAFWTRDCYQYTSANNLFLGAAPQSQLIDWANHDFGLKADAPAIKSGILFRGYTGLLPRVGRPDKGACEFGSPDWKAGVDGWREPHLAVTTLGTGGIKLTAPAEACFFQLLTATNLHPPIAWMPVTEAPTASMTQWSLTLDIAPGQTRLFRLGFNF